VIEELLKIADLQGLTGREPERSRAIHWLIDLDTDGRPLQLSPTTAISKAGRSGMGESRGKQFFVPRLYHMQVMERQIKSVCTNQHNWLPDFLVSPAAEIFPNGVDGNQSSTDWKRRATWRLVFKALASPMLRRNPGVVALAKFLQSRPRFDAIPFPIEDEEERKSATKAIADGKELFSFRVAGRLLIHDPQIRRWWANRLGRMRAGICRRLQQGEDSYQPGAGPLAEYHPPVFSSVPLFSYDKAPFMSFGLGRQTTRLRLETSEKMAGALNWLMNDESSSLKLGEYSAVFWATTDDRPVAVDFVPLLGASDPLAVRDFLRGPWGGVERGLDTAKFHAALMRKSGKGRFAVNSWHTDTLEAGTQNVTAWFTAIEIPDPQSQDRLFLTIRTLAECTVRKSRETRPLPATYQTLFDAALFGSPIPYKLFAAVLARQSLELAKGTDKKKRKEFENRLCARTALIQAFFALTKGETMSDSIPSLETNAGYLCGRLLAFLDRIHVAAHRESGGTNSSPANRVYGAASTTPALVFPQLCKLVRYHLNKIGGGLANRLEYGYPAEDPPFEGLAAICARLRTSGAEFPRTLSLEDQGRFAIGFYYERCRPWPTKAQDNSIAGTDK
jgi:CRISPR-associated protein Csd1